jgi:hypothetical protein
MITNAIQTWLATLQLDFEQMVLAGLALKLAESFDESGNTSTAAELRKTVLELQRSLKGSVVEYDPLAQIMTR